MEKEADEPVQLLVYETIRVLSAVSFQDAEIKSLTFWSHLLNRWEPRLNTCAAIPAG